MIENIHHIIEPHVGGGIRKIPGTVIMNTKTKEVLYNFNKQMSFCSDLIKEKCPKIYLHELIKYLFYDFYMT